MCSLLSLESFFCAWYHKRYQAPAWNFLSICVYVCLKRSLKYTRRSSSHEKKCFYSSYTLAFQFKSFLLLFFCVRYLSDLSPCCLFFFLLSFFSLLRLPVDTYSYVTSHIKIPFVKKSKSENKNWTHVKVDGWENWVSSNYHVGKKWKRNKSL